MKPQSEVGGGRPSKGTLPANNKDAQSGQGAYSPGYPTYKPQSEVSTGSTPPTTVGGAVPWSSNVATNPAGLPIQGITANMPVKKSASRTSPTDKSKNAGVE